jgi:TolA-binding protein
VDCERFDRIVLDYLYDELDELTAAAAKRHVEQCARCRGIVAGLRATREVGALPLVDPPEGLELRILEAERQVRERLPMKQRAGRAVSVLAGYAMRPQLAMAALLLLAIGSGLVFFRQRPNDRDTVSITERGVAESDPEPLSVLPRTRKGDALKAVQAQAPVAAAAPREAAAKSAASPPASASVAADGREGEDSVYQAALAAYRAGRYREARQQFESVVAQGGADSARAAYYAALSAKGGEGCGSAATLFDQVSQHYPGTSSGYDATWEAAGCYETLGDTERARRSYQALLDEGSYSARARAALAQLDRADGPSEIAARKRAPVAAAAEAPVKAKPSVGSGAGSVQQAPGSEPVAPKQAAPPPQNNESAPKTKFRVDPAF